MEIKGIDVATFQGEIEWKKAAADGVDFAMIRVGGRGYGSGAIYEDARFADNLREAEAAGVDCGVYFFSQAISETEAREEARHVLDRLSGHTLAYPVAIDTEWISDSNGGRANSLSRTARTDIVNAFCTEIKAGGYYPLVYADKNWLTNHLESARLIADVWLAQYNDKPTYTGKFTMWQHSSKGRVAGFRGNVDLDVCYVDYPALIRAAGLNGLGKPEPEPEPAPEPEPDTAMKAGDAVRYAGRLYGDSYGGNPGKTVDGTFTVDRVIEGRAYGVHIASGWLESAKCRKPVPAESAPSEAEKPAEPASPAKPALRVGARVRCSGVRVHATATGDGAGKTVSGEYEVTRYLPGRPYGVHIGGLGWIRPEECGVVG